MADYITKTALGDLLLAVLYFTTCGLGACLLACDFTLTQAERLGTTWGCLCFIGLGACVLWNRHQTKTQNTKRNGKRTK